MAPRTEAPPRRVDARMRRTIAAVAATGVVLSALALVLMGVSVAFSVAVGAALAAGNLWALARIIAALLPDETTGGDGASRPASSGWVLVALLKMFGLLAAVWLLMRYGVVSPLPLLVGFGSLPIGIAIGALVSDRSARD